MADPFVDDPDFTLIVGDALEVLRSLSAESVHCCVTSPPYWGLRDYSTSGQLGLEATPDQYVANMVAVFREVRRVLRADGTLWLNIGDSYANDTKWGGTTGGKHAAGLHAAAGGLGREKHTTGLKPKDLVGIPWRLAFALQTDGWYLRSDIIWSKPNPMPESVTDRPTKAHEYLFLLTKNARYFYDADAIREPHAEPWRGNGEAERNNWSAGGTAESRGSHETVRLYNPAGRNKRSVWEIATEAYPDAHFATFPQALVEPCVKAGCPEWVCGTCGKARERITGRPCDKCEALIPTQAKECPSCGFRNTDWREQRETIEAKRAGESDTVGPLVARRRDVTPKSRSEGWSDCGHNNYQPGTVLDPFLGSGTTAQVARRLGRRCVGIELNPEYARLAAKRLAQLSLFACVVDESAGLAEETA